MLKSSVAITPPLSLFATNVLPQTSQQYSTLAVCHWLMNFKWTTPRILKKPPALPLLTEIIARWHGAASARGATLPKLTTISNAPSQTNFIYSINFYWKLLEKSLNSLYVLEIKAATGNFGVNINNILCSIWKKKKSQYPQTAETGHSAHLPAKCSSYKCFSV